HYDAEFGMTIFVDAGDALSHRSDPLGRADRCVAVLLNNQLVFRYVAIHGRSRVGKRIMKLRYTAVFFASQSDLVRVSNSLSKNLERDPPLRWPTDRLASRAA